MVGELLVTETTVMFAFCGNTSNTHVINQSLYGPIEGSSHPILEEGDTQPLACHKCEVTEILGEVLINNRFK